MKAVRSLLVPAVIACLALAISPARAAPANTRIDKVFKLPCEQSVCSTTRDDAKIDPSQAVTGSVQIQVSSSSSIGLDQARLEARRDNGEWFCLKQWNLDTASFDTAFNWNTHEWPGGCPGAPDHDTRNGEYDLRLISREKISGEQQTSSIFPLDVVNKPATPSWSGALRASGESAREPVVELRFDENAEPDIFEYHYVRIAPNGSEEEWAVSAAKPGGQGCDKEGSTYVCYDDVFAARGFAGTYTYLLIAYRQSPAGSDRCALSPGPRCVQSPVSDSRSISLQEPVDAPSAGSTPAGKSTRKGATGTARGSTGRGGSVTGGRSGGPSDADFFTGTYDKSLPYGKRPYSVARDGSSAADITESAALPEDEPLDGTSVWRSIAGGLLMLLAAAHVGRILRRA